MHSSATSIAPPVRRTARRSAPAGRSFAVIGMAAVLAALTLNEYTVALLFAPDAVITGTRTLAWIRGVEILGIVLGLALVAWRIPLESGVVALVRRKPRTAAGALGVVTVAALIVIVELSFLAHNTVTARNRPPTVVTYSAPLWQPDVTVHSRKTIGGRLIYDATYRRDAAGARLTPDSPAAFTGRDVVFFGCSFTFGQGVNDGETLPNQLARRMPGWRVTNFGYPGHGSAHMLEALNDPDTLEPYANSELVVIYVFIPNHLRRTVGSMRIATTWGRNFPNFAPAADGTLAPDGTFTTGRPTLAAIYEVLARESVMNYFNVDLPLRVRDSDLAMLAKIDGQSRDRIADDCPDADFRVVLFPDGPNVEFPASRLIPFLEAAGIRYFDYSDRLHGESGMWIPGDGHPTPEAYARVAQWLAEDLGPAAGTHQRMTPVRQAD